MSRRCLKADQLTKLTVQRKARGKALDFIEYMEDRLGQSSFLNKIRSQRKRLCLRGSIPSRARFDLGQPGRNLDAVFFFFFWEQAHGEIDGWMDGWKYKDLRRGLPRGF